MDLVVSFLELGNTRVDIFDILPRYLKFSGEFGLQNLVSGRNPTGYHPALVQIFCGSFSQGTWHTLFHGVQGDICPSS